MYDAFRVLVIFTGLFSVGTLAALYFRLGRLVLPQWAMSLLVLSNIVICLNSAAGAYARLGQGANVRVAIAGIAILAEFCALVGLYRWYGTDEGIEHMKRMQAGRRKRDVWNRRHPS